MKIFFDTEFTGLVPNTQLISIGLISETNKAFYAEFTDYNKDLCDEWIQKNVIANLLYNDLGPFVNEGSDYVLVHSDSLCIRAELEKWLLSFGERVQLVSDVCHYDMTLFCNLFGGAFNIPPNVNPVCYDISQDISKMKYKIITAETMMAGFNASREKICKTLNNGFLPKENSLKHNSLYDAKVIKMIYDGMYKEKLKTKKCKKKTILDIVNKNKKKRGI